MQLRVEIKLKEYGINQSATEMMREFQGVKLSFIIEQLETKFQVKFNPHFISSYRRIVDRLFEEHLKPCEGVLDMLESIKLPICVASSGPKEKIKKALSLTGLLGHFNNNIFSSYDIKSWKPDPEIFIHAATEMGYHLNRCAVLEDSTVGISAAISAGTMPIHYDPSNNGVLIEGVYKISHMNELNELIYSMHQ